MLIEKPKSNEEWMKWRSKKLSASIASIVLGVNPWDTRYALWCRLTGLEKQAEKTNYYMARGLELEPQIRAQIEIEYGEDYREILAQHDEYDFIIATPDGYNEKTKTGIEIKVANESVYLEAKNGRIIDYYKPQVAQQRMCTGADKIIFHVRHIPDKYKPDEYLEAKVIYEKDEKYEAKLLDELIKFWNLVQTKTPPELSDKDYVRVYKDDQLEQLMSQYEKISTDLNEAETKLEILRQRIKDYVKQDRIQYGNYKISTIYKRGAVDTSLIPQLANVDLEKYRKPPVTQFVIRRINK